MPFAPLRQVAKAILPACAALLVAQGPAKPSFDHSVSPVLTKNCLSCHNDRVQSGSVNLAPLNNPATVLANREDWEKVVQKVRSGEMPPKGMPRPSLEQVGEFTKFLESEWERADRNVKPDPGRVTARRLNRVEYTNTIRDLLAVDFRAEKDFPTDDSGYGFDNIGDVLTISPVLMEKYIEAAETIASRALGATPLPNKPLEFEYHLKTKTIRRLDRSTIEATHRVDWDGEYEITIGLPGERAKDAAPVEMAFFMDGKPIHKQLVETKPSGLVYFNPYSEERFRVFLPEGDHTFRAAFLNDDFVKTLSDREAFSDKKNKFLNMIKFTGPYPAKVERASRKKILTCDPNTGQACVTRILTSLARRAYRRPVTRTDIAPLENFVAMARKEGQSVEQGIQLALQAMLVSPHFLFRIEKHPAPNDPTRISPVNDLELASRLSYFLWSSMPDDELLGLAETGKLRAPGTLDAQVKRMLADPRSAALAENFAGQWLEIRNLDSVKPDPQKFPEWGPELKEAMRTETRLFFEHILRENRPLTEFLTARYTFLNELLAKHYGISGVTGPDFRRVDLATDQRGGILSHASILTVSSYPTRTSPVIRGKYVLQNVLGVPPPVPPPDVPPLDESTVGSAGSLRQQMEKHRSNAVCASCHNRMDTLGFGLENYDATGKWRTKDGKFDIDVAGTLPNGKSFQTPAEMRMLLLESMPEFTRCITEKMLTYSLGRGLERFDRRTVEAIGKKLAANNYPFQLLIHEIVRSLPFQQRRGEAPKTETAPKAKQVAQR
jgi:mono/diheme cytochrome c family protein